MSDYPGNDHELTVTIDNEGDLNLRIECNAVEGAQCRLLCEEGCEEFSYEDHQHPLVDSGECMPLVYIHNQDSVLEAYEGDLQPFQSGVVTLNYHSGDYYVGWRYPTAAESEVSDT